MNKYEMKEAFIECIERERTKKGWKQQEMANKLNMSLPGYRKMIAGLTETLSLSTVMTASELFKIPIRTMCGCSELQDKVCEMVFQQSDTVCERVKGYLEWEMKNKQAYQDNKQSKLIDVVRLTGYFMDGMILDSFFVEKKEVNNTYLEGVRKALLVTENTLLPIYGKGDLLLIDDKLARNGDIGLFQNLLTRKFYIRKVVIKDKYELHPINKKGEIIYITQEERKNWIDFGHVVSSIRA